jgi:hypothetical protein
MTKHLRAQVKTGRGTVDAQRVASTPTTTERALVILLNEWRADREGVAADLLGAKLWPDRTGRISAPHGGGDYAAQMLLGRMKKAELVQHSASAGSSRWQLTQKGFRAATLADEGP